MVTLELILREVRWKGAD